MSDENLTAVADGAPETPASAPAEQPTDLEAIVTPEGSADEPVDDLEDIEWDGRSYKVPKGVKAGVMMQADYTRKTQEVAEQRKAIEGERETFAKQTEAHKAHLKDIGKLFAMDERLAEHEKTDWATMTANDPFTAQAKFIEYQQLKDKRMSLAVELNQREQQRALEAQQSFAKRYEDTNAELARSIKGWNQDTANKLREFAKGNGATDDDIRTLAVNPPLVKLLHKAWLGDQLLKKQTSAQPAEPEPAPKPLEQVSKGGGSARNVVSLDKADMDQYVAIRKKQGYGKR